MTLVRSNFIIMGVLLHKKVWRKRKQRKDFPTVCPAPDAFPIITGFVGGYKMKIRRITCFLGCSSGQIGNADMTACDSGVFSL
jgi:hypothetical protein